MKLWKSNLSHWNIDKLQLNGSSKKYMFLCLFLCVCVCVFFVLFPIWSYRVLRYFFPVSKSTVSGCTRIFSFV
jgi:hypothetical protein